MDLTEAPPHPAGPDATTVLDALAAAYWDAYLEADPLFATAIGDRRFDDRVPDPTPEGRASTRARFLDILDRADALDADAFEGEVRITLLMLRQSIASDIAELDAGLTDWNVDPLDGVPARFLLVPDYQRLETLEDGRRMVDRWRAMAVHTDRHLDNLRRSLADGRVASRPPTERTVAILDAPPARRHVGLAAPRAAARPRGPVRLDNRGPGSLRGPAAGGRGRRDPAGVRQAARRARRRGAAQRAPGGPTRHGRAARWRRRLPRADPRPHLARPRRGGDPPDRPRRDRADRRRAGRPGGPHHRRLEPGRRAGPPAQRPRAPLRDPGRGVRRWPRRASPAPPR